MSILSTRFYVLMLFILSILLCFSHCQTNPATEQSKSQLIPITDAIKIPILDFKNTEIRDVLQALGMQYKINIYVDPNVSGEISLYMTNISVRDAIDFIIKKKGFDYTVENKIVKVFKPLPPPPQPPAVAPVLFHIEKNLLTIDIKDLSAQEVARYFVDSAKINVVIGSTSTKTITTKLNNIDPEKAVRIVFENNGFNLRLNDGVFYVTQASTASSEASTGSYANSTSSFQRMNIRIDSNRLVSLEVTNAPLDDIIRSIAVETKLNIVMYDKITGVITAKCDSTSIDNILRFLLQNTSFTFWKDQNIYFIGSKEMSLQKTNAIIPLRHIRAEEGGLGKIIPPRIVKDAVIKYDNEHNAIIVIGSFDIVAEAQDFIQKIDKPIPQVLIEALVVEFNLSKIRSYGVSIFTGLSKDSSIDWMSEQFLPTLNLKPGVKKTIMILNSIMRYIGAKKIIELPKNFKSSIQALETADIVKVHSTPQIATINGNTASITIGETRYYKLSKETISTTNNPNQNVLGIDQRFEEKKFNTQLEVTPWVMADGYVMVDIRPEFNIPRSGGDIDRPPTIDTRVIKSMVRLKDGQTIVLGGQRQTENLINSKGIPLLSSIPIIGWLFSSKTISRSETQMMIFLTPHVYYGDEVAVAPDDYFGSEINKMIEKNDPDLRKKKEKEHQQKSETNQKKSTVEPSNPIKTHDSTILYNNSIISDSLSKD